MFLNDIKYPIKDNMDGSYTFTKQSKKRKEYIKFNLIPCQVCDELQVIYHRYRNKSKKPCSRECKRIYAQAQETPIRYNHKLYTIDDVPNYIKNKYHNPIRRFVNKTKWEDEHLDRPGGKKSPENLIPRKTQEEKDEYNRARQIEYRTKNPEKCRQWAKDYVQRNPLIVRVRNLTRTISRQMLDQEMVTKFKDGVDIVKAVKHLETQAIDIMKELGYKSIKEVLDTHHIDHIVPKSLYDLTIPSEFAKANHHLNLRLITAFENLSKGPRIRPEDIEAIKSVPIEIYPMGFNSYLNKIINKGSKEYERAA
tara:strand:- start:20093 stop:21019 length:927 start_codon:yes stop_codon:yes gene_type:complete